MAEITKIEVQKKNVNKVNIYVDENFYHGLYLDTCLKYSLAEDMEISLEKLDEIILESEKQLAFNKVVAYIGEGLKSKKQVKDYLKKKEYGKPTIDYVIQKLEEYNYLNDEKYCEVFIRTYKNKFGKHMLKSKLIEKGINQEIIENQLSDFESSEEEIMGVLTKKLKNKPLTDELLTKTIRFMLSRGFSYEETKNAINKFKSNNLSTD